MVGFFHTFAETNQTPLMFDQFGETVFVSAIDEDGAFTRTENTRYRALAIIKVIESELDSRTSQSFVVRAEVLLRQSCDSDAFDITKLRTPQVIGFRDQTFRIEAIGPLHSGFRKAMCVATKREFTSAIGGR